MSWSTIWHLVVIGAVALAVVALVLRGLGGAVREGIAEGKAEFRRQQDEQAALAAAEAERMRAELAGFSEEERRGILLQAPFREFLFNGPLLPLQWPEEQRIWLETYKLPADRHEATRRALAKEWGIDGPDSLKQRVEWLLTEGHRDDIDDIFELAEAAPDDPLLRELTKSGRGAVEAARGARERCGPARGAAFDLARAATLVVDGMALGDLEPGEGRALLRECDREAARLFSGWRQYGESFLAGGEIWMTLSGLMFAGVQQRWWRKTIDWLVEDPASPWTATPWPRPAEPLPASPTVH